MGHEAYPWFGIVKGNEIEQGDLLEDCPVYFPNEELAGFLDVHVSESVFEWEERDTVVMSQTCDMVKGRERISEVLLCPVWRRSDLNEGHLATDKGMENARRGNLPGITYWQRVRSQDMNVKSASLIFGVFIRCLWRLLDAGRPNEESESAFCLLTENNFRKLSHVFS